MTLKFPFPAVVTTQSVSCPSAEGCTTTSKGLSANEGVTCLHAWPPGFQAYTAQLTPSVWTNRKTDPSLSVPAGKASFAAFAGMPWLGTCCQVCPPSVLITLV